MKVGVVSDTHVPSLAPRIPDALWEALAGCDCVLHAGDFEDWKVYREFAKRFPTHAVIGNRDNFLECEEVPKERIVEIEGHRIGMTHGQGPPQGLPERIVRNWSKGPVDLLIFGHSHQPGIHTVNGDRLLNPGSPTDTVIAERRTFAILHVGDQIEIEVCGLRGS